MLYINLLLLLFKGNKILNKQHNSTVRNKKNRNFVFFNKIISKKNKRKTKISARPQKRRYLKKQKKNKNNLY